MSKLNLCTRQETEIVKIDIVSKYKEEYDFVGILRKKLLYVSGCTNMGYGYEISNSNKDILEKYLSEHIKYKATCLITELTEESYEYYNKLLRYDPSYIVLQIDPGLFEDNGITCHQPMIINDERYSSLQPDINENGWGDTSKISPDYFFYGYFIYTDKKNFSKALLNNKDVDIF